MSLTVSPEVIVGAFISILLAIVAYFVKQLHKDFKRVETNLSEVKTTVSLIKAEFKGINEMMNQKIDFLEKRLAHIETIIFRTHLIPSPSPVEKGERVVGDKLKVYQVES